MKFYFQKFKKLIYSIIIFALLLQSSGIIGFWQPSKAKAGIVTVVLNEFMANPSSGNEWIEFYNNSASSVDISGWYIKDAANNTFSSIIGAGISIPSGGYYTLTDSSVLNNTGDTLTLYNSSDNQIDTKNYAEADVTQGKTIGRIPDGTGSWQINLDPTMGTQNQGPDVTAPSSSITYPVDGNYYNNLNPITGTASDDNSGVQYVDIKVLCNSGTCSGKYFSSQTNNWETYDANFSWLRTTGTLNWSYAFDNSKLTDGYNYTITSRATDNNNNPEFCSTVTFYYDKTAPTGSIKIDDGKGVTNSTNATLTLDSNEAQKIKIWGDGTPEGGTDWQDYNTSRNLTLSDGNGNKIMHVQYKDQAGNISQTYDAQIYYNDKAENITKKNLIAGDNQIKNDNIVLNINAKEPTSITIATYISNPETNPTMTAFGKYFDISAEDSSKINFPVTVKIYFTDTDLINAGITSLSQIKGLYYWDNSSSSWKLYTNTGVTNPSDILGYAGYVWAEVDHFTPMSLGADTEAPTKPANFKAESQDNKVKLTWDEVSDAKGYYVRYREVTNEDSSKSYTEVYMDGKTNHDTTITGLTNNVLYEFGVRAIDDTENKGEWAVVVASPKKTSQSSEGSSGFYGYYGVNTAYAADDSTSNETTTETNKNKNETETDKTTSEEAQGETQGARTAVTIGIIIIAIGAALGGYYGYQWWLGEGEVKETTTPVKKDTTKSSGKKKVNRRW